MRIPFYGLLAMHSDYRYPHKAASSTVAILILLGIVVSHVSFAGADEAAIAFQATDAELLDLLRANDAQLDNVAVEVDQKYFPNPTNPPSNLKRKAEFELIVDPSVDRSGMPELQTLVGLAKNYVGTRKVKNTKEPPTESKKWVQLLREEKIRLRIRPPASGAQVPRDPQLFRLVCGIRWPDVAVEQSRLRNGQVDSIDFKKWTSVGQQVQILMPYRDKSDRTWDRISQTQPVSLNTHQEFVLWLKLALGVGYAELIADVTGRKIEGKRLVLYANMHIWKGQTSTARLELDEALIVRMADIDCGITRIRVENSGAYSLRQGFACADKGKFERIYVSDSKKTSPKFEVALRSIRFQLPDSDFLALSNLKPPAGEKLAEYDLSARSLPPGTNASFFGWSLLRILLLVVNAIFLIIVVGLLIRRRFTPVS